jgi:hypothetical protein
MIPGSYQYAPPFKRRCPTGIGGEQTFCLSLRQTKFFSYIIVIVVIVIAVIFIVVVYSQDCE